MKIVHLSDTHCQIHKIKIPDADLLIISGDATFRGSIQELSEFNAHLGWLKSKFKHGIIFVPGNHDWLFERNEPLARTIVSNATVLINQEITIEGIKFYGSPVTPEFHSWAFNVNRGPEIREYWDLIPNDTRVLITHGPPLGILDKCPNGDLAGCEELTKRIHELKQLTHHLFGHIHLGYGQRVENGVLYINGSNCTEAYKPTNPAITFEVV